MTALLRHLLQHRVMAGIIMGVFILGGWKGLGTIRQEMLPEREAGAVQVSVVLTGAQPKEIEDAILLPVEIAVQGLDGIKRVESAAREDAGSVTLVVLENADIQQVLNDVKNAVDRIETFPLEAEEPVVTIPSEVEKVMSLVVHGDQPLVWLRQAADNVRNDLLTEVGLTKVQLSAPREPEISVELTESTLRAHGLTLGDVAGRIQDNALDLAGGTVYSSRADIAVRTNERRERAIEFTDIVVAETRDGVPLTLDQIATVTDGFGNSPIEAWFNGNPAIQVDIYAVGSETPLSVEADVTAYLSDIAARRYQGLFIDIFENDAQAYRERVALLVDNALAGLALVVVVLGLFLAPGLAFWVMAGIPTALLGSFLFLPLFGTSINMISLFAFIVTIGVVVDDAIIVGEAVYTHRCNGMSPLDSAVQGIREMGVPVLLAVSTTMIVFMPMFFLPGPMGVIFKQIPAVVVAVLVVSLVEALFILPAHLSKEMTQNKWLGLLARPQKRVNQWLERFTQGPFLWLVRKGVAWPGVVIGTALSLLGITIAALAGGLAGFSFTPSIQADTVIAQATLPYGTPRSRSVAVQEQLVRDAQAIMADHGMASPGIFSLIGARLEDGEIEAGTLAGTHYVSVLAALPPEEERHLAGREFARQWQERFGDPGGLEALNFTGETNVTGGEPVRLELFHPDDAVARQAALSLGERMRQIPGLVSVDDGLRAGKPELTLTLKDQAARMGLTARDLGAQVRHRFYGAEALRISHNGNETKVMVRLDAEERKNPGLLEDLLLRTPAGSFIPLSDAAVVTRGNTATSLSRRDGRRIYPVTADIMAGVPEDAVEAALEDEAVKGVLRDFPGLRVNFGGEAEEIGDTLSALGKGFVLALFGMYALLALQFNSYIQPVQVLAVIPFSFIGAVWGHILLGYDLSIMSVTGMIAMAGVVVNDSLVLVTAFNRNRKHGMGFEDAVADAACGRLRPILLTTLTTFFGLAPMMLETSEQAQFLIPMAVSLSFGLMFGTMIVLVLVPVLLRRPFEKGLVNPGNPLYCEQITSQSNTAGKGEALEDTGDRR